MAHTVLPITSEALTKMASLKHWGEPPRSITDGDVRKDAIVDCGWGRLAFGQTFVEADELATVLQAEAEGQRDIAFYVRDPHVLLSRAPQSLFLDPSHTFRINLDDICDDEPAVQGIVVRLATADDEADINRIFLARGMVPLRRGYVGAEQPKAVQILVAEEEPSRGLLGVVLGVDHRQSFRDPDNGSSLWSLAVDTQAKIPGIGRTLLMSLVTRFREAGRSFMDLSVMHDNQEAILLYEKLGFRQIPVYCVKKKNTVNEKLFMGPVEHDELNPYARIIVDEARRRGINVEIEDVKAGIVRLSLGGRSISCRESLSDLTSAVAMSRCDDKMLTQRLLAGAGLKVPAQAEVRTLDDATRFLEMYRRVVVKPARGEQGRGVMVDLTSRAQVQAAIEQVQQISDTVLIEQFVPGEDLRIIVIGGEVIAAAVRRPATIVGDGVHNILQLIEKQSRRRAAATQGESRIPLDEETERCVALSRFQMLDVLPAGYELTVRRTANLHTGGTIHDVTDKLHPVLIDAATKAAAVLQIPVVGLDLLVEAPDRPLYYVIEANERPGLANHEPAPTAERFIDLLFPTTRPKTAKEGALN